MDINYELYKVFYYVAKTLSFSEAAAELFISQSAVSQSVKVLEKRLNQVLFIRSTKRVSLTKEGEMLFKHIEPAINLISRGENQLLNSTPAGGMQLRIAASDTICRYFLVPYLNNFHKSYPEVHIRIINGTSLKCAELLETNQVDLIVVNSPNSALNNNLNIQDVTTFRDVFVVKPEAFPLTNHKLTLTELQKLPILMLTKLSTTSAFLHNLFLQQSLDLVPAIELSSNDLLIDLAKIGLGIAFVPDFCINNINSSELITLETADEMPERKLVVAYDDSLPLSEPAQFFINSMLSKL
ncbi:LysR family transcriptional regulator [Lachnoclostridium sp.]|uniref:LysR family transcriptional regulator n=1 Tax=Lachnoclostridium sp. TaxID=2028282 RepID=UPI00289D3B0D|nr:LysR family transcriptional regulator [Lachnoclostridium sp.]